MVHRTSPDGSKQVRLSPRERDLLIAICQGNSPGIIAFREKRTDASVHSAIHHLTKGLAITGIKELYIWGVTHPTALFKPGEFVELGSHPAGCECSEYCVLMGRLRSLNGAH